MDCDTFIASIFIQPHGASAPPWTMGWLPPIAAPSVGACDGRGERVTVGVPMESVKVGVNS
jgi:hypothetical protein